LRQLADQQPACQLLTSLHIDLTSLSHACIASLDLQLIVKFLANVEHMFELKLDLYDDCESTFRLYERFLLLRQAQPSYEAEHTCFWFHVKRMLSSLELARCLGELQMQIDELKLLYGDA